jgi:hypothetical protein
MLAAVAIGKPKKTRVIGRLLREALLHFLLIGATLLMIGSKYFLGDGQYFPHENFR